MKLNKQAHKEGLRARSAYKLLDIQKKFKIIKNDDVIVDLGAYPGGWSQVASRYGQVYAIDKKKIRPLDNCILINKDIFSDDLFKDLPEEVDVILSDLSPNISGNKEQDQANMGDLMERTLDIIDRILKEKGNFVFKIFQGRESKKLVDKIKKEFRLVKTIKPRGSKSKSKEMYILGLRYRKI